MLVLGIDTSSALVTAGLAWLTRANTEATSPDEKHRLVGGEGREGAGVAELAPNRHGEMLAPLIEALLDQTARSPGELDAIGVGLGPGPFTGLRVGIMTAKAMGDALNIPVYGVCSLDVIAQHSTYGRQPFAVVTDARRKQVYWRLYDEHALPVGPPDLARPDDLSRELHRGGVAQVVGAGVDLYPNAFADFVILNASHDDRRYPNGHGVADLALDLLVAGERPGDLTPLYLRRPDATPPGKPKSVTPS